MSGWKSGSSQYLASNLIKLISCCSLTVREARPFMVLARAALGLPCDLGTGPDSSSTVWLSQVQYLVQAILGLQNDILGWEKDFQTGNQLNAIQVLIRDGTPASTAFQHVLHTHNQLVRVLVGCQAPPGALYEQSSWKTYLNVIFGFGSAMAEWMLSSRRYQSAYA